MHIEAAHRGVVRLIFGADYVDLSDSEVVLHMATPAFDAATFEIWAPLLHGGRCVVLPQRRPSVRKIGGAIESNGITTAFLTTGLFHAVVDESPLMLSGLRQLLVGGEVLSVSHVRRALELLPDVQISDVYGPTECTTFACSHRIGPGITTDAASVPIGKPIANTEAYVLDGHSEPALVGTPGELSRWGSASSAPVNRPSTRGR